ncbi:hypothetical protein MUP79_00225 [Candidatus Bathyarchaeota archaeon]|nr:hypothetical protein [Candidatus Bathyarchaeota archaeon]
MTQRKGLGKGMGTGYKNLIPKDPMVHRQSALGMKQAQQLTLPEFKIKNPVVHVSERKPFVPLTHSPDEVRKIFQNFEVQDIQQNKGSDRIFIVKTRNDRRRDFKFDIFIVTFNQRGELGSVIKVRDITKGYSYSFHSGQPFENSRYLTENEFKKLVVPEPDNEEMSHSQGGGEYIAAGAGQVLGGAGEVLGGAGRAIGGIGEGTGRAVGGLGEGIGTRIGEGGKQRTIKEEREYLKDVDVLEEHRLERAQKLRAANQIPTPVRSTVTDSSDTIRRMELQAEMEREMARQAQRDKQRQDAEAEAQRKKELLLYGRG